MSSHCLFYSILLDVTLDRFDDPLTSLGLQFENHPPGKWACEGELLIYCSAVTLFPGKHDGQLRSAGRVSDGLWTPPSLLTSE